MTAKPQACTTKRYTITRQQLPLCCPLSSERVWDAHPRVYLPIEKLGHVVCPYCETEYLLQDIESEPLEIPQ